MTIRPAAQQRHQLDFWPELQTTAMTVAARLYAPLRPHWEAAATANAERSGACPQRSEDSRRGAPLMALPAINFGGYGGVGTTSVPVGNAGTTFTGQSL